MKKITTLMILVLLCFHALPQEKPTEPLKAGKRFLAGISYSYMKIDMKLTALSLHSVWNGQDLGTQDLTEDEIGEIDSMVTRTNQMNNLSVDFGMKILDKPGLKWTIEGTVMAGLAHFTSNVYNTVTDTKEYMFNSGFSKPAFGIGFVVGYRFSSHWGLSLKPWFSSTFGKITHVEDNVNLTPVNVTQTGVDKFYALYERVSLTADYTAGPVTITAGPGFYRANAIHKYTITRTNDLNGEVNTDEIITHTISRNFIDGTVSVTWRIIEPLTLNAIAGIGHDLIINAGLHYNF